MCVLVNSVTVQVTYQISKEMLTFWERPLLRAIFSLMRIQSLYNLARVRRSDLLFNSQLAVSGSFSRTLNSISRHELKVKFVLLTRGTNEVLWLNRIALTSSSLFMHL